MKILFVCTANICRSALAESILRKKLRQEGLTDIFVDSAGVRDYAGEPYDSKMALLASNAEYDMDGYAKPLSSKVLENADMIICMEHFHKVEVQKRLPYAKWNHIHLFNEICFGKPTDLIDPSGNTEYIYGITFQHIEKGCGTLARKLYKMLREGEIIF